MIRLGVARVALVLFIAATAFGVGNRPSELEESVFAPSREPASAVRRWELDLGVTESSFTFGSGNNHNLGLGFGLHYLWMEGLQLGGVLSWSHSNGADELQARAGATFNFPFQWNIRRAFFLTAQLGVAYTELASSLDLVVRTDVGVRVPITGSLIYRPTLGLFKVGSNDMKFQVILIGFSAML